jgi:hypothetical protein
MDAQRKYVFVLLSLSLIILFSFVQVPDKTLATVQPLEGVSVFFLSTPKSNFEYLGTVSVGLTFSGSPEQLITGLIKDARKKYNNFDGLMIKEIKCKQADVIRFK